jgi:anti-sigma regulatory factor (Ser/Thr protein kinase)
MAMHEARASGRPIADRGNNHDGAGVSCQFAATPVSVGEARRVFSATLGAWSLTDHVDTGRLLVSELATNSVVHAESVFEIRILRIPGGVRVEVRDADINLPTPLLVKEGRSSGRGMRLIEELSSNWGAEVEPDGKCVWFELT